jgi:very-short-patch-repair endonuclease
LIVKDAHESSKHSVTTPSKFTRVARTLRKDDTWAEKLLWKWLRDRRFAACKFRRQHPYPPHVLDFFRIEAMVNIELDGFQHGSPEQLLLDANRDAWLEARGIKVLRFWNSRLRTEKDVIRDTIWRVLQERAPQPMPEYCRPMRVGEKLRGV